MMAVIKRSTQIDVAGLDHALALALVPARARIVAATDQAGAAEDLGGIGVVGGSPIAAARLATWVSLSPLTLVQTQ